MIIGFDGSRAFIKARTGTEEYSFQLLKSLAKIDPKNIYKVFVRDDFVKEESWPNNFYFIKVNLPRLWTQVGLSSKSFFEDLDILFVPSHTLPIIRKPGLKTVVTVHDLGSEYLPKSHQVKQRLYLGLMQRHQLKGATKLIAVSKATKEDLVKKIGINPKKVSVIYEGYDKEIFNSNDAQVNTLRHYGLVTNNYFLFVGTVQPRKNLERLIRAFGQFCHPERLAKDLKIKSRDPSPSVQNDNRRLVIIGKKGWSADDIYALPKKLGIQDQVKFLDYVKREDLPALYKGAIALTYPSLFEGFGLPILEAQSCGCPVITSKVSSMPEIAGKGAILVDPYNIDDIVKGMIEIQNSNVKSQKIKAGFENIKRFSWEKCARETLKVLEQVTSNK